MTKHFDRSGIVAVAAVAALQVSINANAEDVQWQFNPQVELGAMANDNYRLLLPSQSVPGVQRSVVGGYADVEVQLRAVNDVDDFKLTPGFHGAEFPNNTANNTTDPLLNLDYTHRGQTMSANITGSYARQSVVETLTGTQTAAASQTGTTGAASGSKAGDLGNSSTASDSGGILNFSNRQQTITLSPDFDIDLTQRGHLQVTADFVDVSFDHVVPGTSVGFKNYGGAVGFAHQLTQRDTVTLRGLAAHNVPDSSAGIQSATTTSYGVQGEWDRRFSKISQAYVRVGDELSTFGNVNGVSPPHQNTWVAGAGINWAFQVSQIFIDATRTIDPNATGLTVESDQLRARYQQDFSAKLTGLVGATGFIDKANGSQSNVAFRERKYASGTVGVKWRFTQAFTLAGAYTYIWQRFQGDPSSAQSNGATLSVIWQPYRDRK